MLKISEFTISLHCGSDIEIVKNQMNLLSDLNKEFKIHWNNRIERHPEMYTSYSEMMNHAIATSKTEWIILINDRVKPTVLEIKKMIALLENGFACVMLYNVGFIGFSKELIREIGWWDERFLYGGWEDRDWVFRLKKKNLAIYESLESTYDYTWKTSLSKLGGVSSGVFWKIKWDTSFNYVVFKNIAEISYPKWDIYLGENKPEIKNSWKKWKKSELNLFYGIKDLPYSGNSGSFILRNRVILNKTFINKKLIFLVFRVINKLRSFKK